MRFPIVVSSELYANVFVTIYSENLSSIYSENLSRLNSCSLSAIQVNLFQPLQISNSKICLDFYKA